MSGVYLNGATIMTTPTARHVDIAREAGFDGVEVRAERLLGAPDELQAAQRLVRPGEVWTWKGAWRSVARWERHTCWRSRRESRT
jgi:hypothetical protein